MQAFVPLVYMFRASQYITHYVVLRLDVACAPEEIDQSVLINDCRHQCFKMQTEQLFKLCYNYFTL